MKIIFCDVDGVLLPFSYSGQAPLRKFGQAEFSKAAVQHLNEILKTDAKIVISSAWRHWGLDHMKKLFQNNGIDSNKVIDCTGNENGDREHQVQCWLDRNPNTTKFVILDDASDFPTMLPKLIKPNSYVGLTEKDAKQALLLLA